MALGSRQVELLGATVHGVDMAGALDRIAELRQRGGGHLVVTPNLDHLAVLRGDNAMRRAYDLAELRLVDGFPLVLAARVAGTPVQGRVTGADLLPSVCAVAAASGQRVMVLGGEPEVAAAGVTRLAERYPGLDICSDSPPLGFERDLVLDRAAVEAVRAVAPDFLFVCIGAPRAEIWAGSHLEELGDVVVMCVGAAIDFAAEAVQRAPALVQRVGAEWLWRLAHEPARLWRRYLIRDLPFAILLFADAVRRRAGLLARRASA